MAAPRMFGLNPEPSALDKIAETEANKPGLAIRVSPPILSLGPAMLVLDQKSPPAPAASSVRYMACGTSTRRRQDGAASSHSSSAAKSAIGQPDEQGDRLSPGRESLYTKVRDLAIRADRFENTVLDVDGLSLRIRQLEKYVWSLAETNAFLVAEIKRSRTESIVGSNTMHDMKHIKHSTSRKSHSSNQPVLVNEHPFAVPQPPMLVGSHSQPYPPIDVQPPRRSSRSQKGHNQYQRSNRFDLHIRPVTAASSENKAIQKATPTCWEGFKLFCSTGNCTQVQNVHIPAENYPVAKSNK